jgi:hypothetical protein
MTTSSRFWTLFAVVVGVVALTAGGYALRFRSFQRAEPPSPKSPDDPADIAEQVHNFCGGSCHAYPPPDTFPRAYWRSEVERGYRFAEQAGLTRKVPPIESVVRYYQSRAPEEFPVPKWEAPSHPLPVRFVKQSYPGPALPPGERFAISNVNLVRLPAPGAAPGKGLDVLACDMHAGLVMLLRPYEKEPTWQVLASHAENKIAPSNPAHTEVIDLDGDGILDVLVADLGSFPPTDRRCGRVVWLRGEKNGKFTPITLLEGVGRVADVQAADFRGLGKGKLDLIVGEFGWQAAGVGQILYLENQTTDWGKPKFVPRTLDDRHGAIHVPIAPKGLDGRGKPDFVALFAQEHETVVAFVNQGDGKFEKKTLYTAENPGYGSSGIQLVDLDGDGKLDVLYSNGDTLDEPYLFKPYHSVQWLRNEGDLRFTHRPLTPMYGVHRAVAGDLCGNSRQDVVAVSFLPQDKFPARHKRRADAVIVLEQVAAGKFERHSLSVGDCDHVTCAVGDVYGTGRLDVVAGNFSSVVTADPVTIWKNAGKMEARLVWPRDRLRLTALR